MTAPLREPRAIAAPTLNYTIVVTKIKLYFCALVREHMSSRLQSRLATTADPVHLSGAFRTFRACGGVPLGGRVGRQVYQG